MSSLFITRAIEGLGDAKVSLNYQILSIILCGACMWFGVNGWGINGMLTGWLVSSPVVYIYLLSKIAKKLDIPPPETTETSLKSLVGQKPLLFESSHVWAQVT